MNDIVKNLFLWLIIAAVLMSVFSNFGQRGGAQTRYDSQFLTMVNQGEVKQVVIDGRAIQGVTRSDQRFTTYMPMEDTGLISDLLKNDVAIEGKPPEQTSFLMQIFLNWFPILLFIGVWIFFMRQMQGGGRGGAMSFGKSRARLLGENEVKVTFADVAGADEAKEEVTELVDFLKDPAKFQSIGGRIPRGVLMVGSPGTGKTLLAVRLREKLVCLSSPFQVPILWKCLLVLVLLVCVICSSKQKNKRLVLFSSMKLMQWVAIDGAGLGGGHDEREQTLNQLLVEMDGFSGSEGVIVIAATNRPDVLRSSAATSRSFRSTSCSAIAYIKGREANFKVVHLTKSPQMIPSM